MSHPSRSEIAVAAVVLLAMVVPAAAPAAAASAPSRQVAALPDRGDAGIAPWVARFGRSRPVVAIVGENGGTELTDYVIPFAVLKRAGVGEVVALAARPGSLTMRPALHVQPDATIADFDARFPDGADYVIVPAVVRRDDPALLAWIAAQGGKGATIVSICDGALVVAATRLMDGHRGTAHWATRDLRRKTYPAVHWVDDQRYVADGRIISSAGISAAIPISLALVEAIAGRPRATEVARDLGVADWGPAHDSRAFEPRFGHNLMAFATTLYLNRWFHPVRAIGVPVAPGVDELALAITADAYSRTGRSRAYAVAGSSTPIVSRNGLVLIPDRVAGATDRTDRDLAPLAEALPARALDGALAAIAHDYGRSTALGVAMDFEYPDYHD